MPSTETIFKMWKMGRTRYTNLLPDVTEEKLTLRLHPQSNSVGFLMRHIPEVEQAFLKIFFGIEIPFVPKAVGQNIQDDGIFTNLNELLEFDDKTVKVVTQVIKAQKESDWEEIVESPIFGKISKAEAIARSISHTGYHAGQIGLILKYAG